MIKLLTSSKPSFLSVGDEVMVIATGSAIQDEDQLLKGIKIFEEWGLKCIEQKIASRNWNDLAGNDLERNQDLNPDIKAPLMACARGGWGSARLLEKSQAWETGWLLGFSDTTSILLGRLAAGFYGCIHGPLVTSLYTEPEWSKERLHSLLFGNPLAPLIGGSLVKGKATGPIVVANLTVATHLIGTPFFPDLEGTILVLEDVGEAPYRIDRMLTHWRLAGIFQKIAGLGFGQFTSCISSEKTQKENDLQLKEILKERTADLEIPVLEGLPIGHGKGGNASIHLGSIAELDGGKGILNVYS